MDNEASWPTARRGLTRAQAAELLGVTEREVSRMDGRLLHPVRTADRRYLYDLAEVRAILARSGGNDGARPIVSGETAAAVFELFEGGKTLPQVVIQTKETPTTISYLRAEYDRMVRSMVLPAETVSKLRQMLGVEFRPDSLPDAVQHAISESFREGQTDATVLGEVLDRTTGKMRQIFAHPRVAASATPPLATGLQASVAQGSDTQPAPAERAAADPAAPPKAPAETGAPPDPKAGGDGGAPLR